MTLGDLLVDAFGRIREGVHDVVEGLSADDLAARPTRHANSIAWLVWHLTRIQDDHIADVAGLDQVWTAQGWYDRFALPFPPEATGYAHSSDDVARLSEVDGERLLGYYDAVHEQTLDYVSGLGLDDLDRIVDTRWDPPVTLAVRLVSILNDDQQHVGQAAYVRGLLTDGIAEA